MHLDTCVAQSLKAAATHFGIRILDRREHPLNPGSNYGVRAWSCASLVRTRLKIDIQRRTASALAGLLNSQNFRVLQTVVCVEVAANYVTFGINDDSSHRRIGCSKTDPFARKLKRASHELLVLCVHFQFVFESLVMEALAFKAATIRPIGGASAQHE